MERFLRKALMAIGAIAGLLGLLWLSQGPGRPDAARLGGLLAVLGVVLFWLGYRMGRRAR